MMRDHVIQHLCGWIDDDDYVGLLQKKFLGGNSLSGKSILA
jgi:hypothetical protein